MLKSEQRAKPMTSNRLVIFYLMTMGFCSCQGGNEALPGDTVKLNYAIEKIETEYIEGMTKEESGGSPQIETRASIKLLSAVKSSLLAYQRSFVSRYKVARNLSEGYPVGVIPDADACPAGSEKIKFFMDNQDNGNTAKSGWTGAWSVDGNGNSSLTGTKTN